MMALLMNIESINLAFLLLSRRKKQQQQQLVNSKMVQILYIDAGIPRLLFRNGYYINVGAEIGVQ